MNNNKIGKRITTLRKERKYTQENLAELLNISPQAVSKWENGHALPETGLLPSLSKALDTSVDSLLTDSNIQILHALFGDGMEYFNVTSQLNKLIQNDSLTLDINTVNLSCPINNNRQKYLTIKYQVDEDVFYDFSGEDSSFVLNTDSKRYVPTKTAKIIAATYGTAKANYDVMHKIEHYNAFNWNEYLANHETFPSDPSSDEKDYLTFVYLNQNGIHMVTCEEGESIAYSADKTTFYRKQISGEHFIPAVPALPAFGNGWECSWGAALTAALQAMGIQTTYEQVMGVSGACYRLAFCSPQWDYSSVDGLVSYDYATPGYKAFGFTPRFAAEWGVICGFKENGADLFCRTKYDTDAINNPDYASKKTNDFDYLYVDNWPFIITYFDEKTTPPSNKSNLINSLRIFVDCSKQLGSGYAMGFHAYETWIKDLLDDEWYQNNDHAQFARRFSANQFCSLALYDARKSAYLYLNESKHLLPAHLEQINQISEFFKEISGQAEQIHKLLASDEYLEGEKARGFWTNEKRQAQAKLLTRMLETERKAAALAEEII